MAQALDSEEFCYTIQLFFDSITEAVMGKLARANRLRREAEERLAEVHTLRRDMFSEEAREIIRKANQELSERFDALSDARFQLGPPVSFGTYQEYGRW